VQWLTLCKGEWNENTLAVRVWMIEVWHWRMPVSFSHWGTKCRQTSLADGKMVYEVSEHLIVPSINIKMLIHFCSRIASEDFQMGCFWECSVWCGIVPKVNQWPARKQKP